MCSLIFNITKLVIVLSQSSLFLVLNKPYLNIWVFLDTISTYLDKQNTSINSFQSLVMVVILNQARRVLLVETEIDL